MNLALSNLAWDINDTPILSQLKLNNINQIECIFSKIKDWSELTNDDIVNYKDVISNYGLELYSAQSLFFNIKCNSLVDKHVIIPHFQRLINYSKILGIKILVLGSPKLRKKEINWYKTLIDLFIIVDEMLENTNIKLIIEPNATIYGGEFFYNISEIVNFINENSLKNIRTMIDSHNIILENFEPTLELYKYFDYIEHIHISENGLKNIEQLSFHKNFSKAIKDIGYNKTITYEVMKSPNVLDGIITFSEIYY